MIHAGRWCGRVLTISVSALVLSACGYSGLNSRPVPFAKGSGDDAMRVTVTLESAGNLTPNSEVMVDDVTVGSVRQIRFKNWKAQLTLGLDPGVRLPENAVAHVAQKSLLGDQYLDLAAPSSRAMGRLSDGARIPEASTGVLPDTEHILTASGVLLNGGGLENISSITRELNAAFHGHEKDWRALLRNLETLITRLNVQRSDLVGLLDSNERLAGRLARQRTVLQEAFDEVPAGLSELESQREPVQRALVALAKLGDTAVPIMEASQKDLAANLKDLALALSGVADAGTGLPRAMGLATFPLPVDKVKDVVRGDYANLVVLIDLTLSTLDNDFLSGTPLEGALTGVNKQVASPASLQSSDPLQGPLDADPAQAHRPPPPRAAPIELPSLAPKIQLPPVLSKLFSLLSPDDKRAR